MKPFSPFVLAQLCLCAIFASGSGTEEDATLSKSTCSYPATLTLVSSPNLKVLDENNCDAEFDKAEWQDQPAVSYPRGESGKTYTLLCVDPDPPGYREGQYWLHWLVSNIQGEDFARGDLTKANHLKGYQGPAPPSGSGLHRYMFLAFEERNGRNPALETPENRARFALGPWLQKHSKSLSGPIAGIQFRTRY